MITVLFRVEAGLQMGLGHLRRSLSLAAALKRQGLMSRFLISGDRNCLDLLEQLKVPAEPFLQAPSWTEEDLQMTLTAAHRAQADAILVDAQQLGVRYLTGLRQAGPFLIVRDDPAKFPFPAHLVINGNADAAELHYRSLNGQTQFLLGPEYAVLPEEFWSPFKRVVRPKVQRILVILGGSDPHNLMPRLLEGLSEIPGEISVTAVVGPFFKNQAQIAASLQAAHRSVTLIENPMMGVRELMEKADLAISAAGQALYELNSVGCPTVAIQVGADQAGQLRREEELGCVRVAGEATQADILMKVRQAILALMEDAGARAAMAAAGQRLVDGQGGFRVARVVSSLLQPTEEVVKGFQG